MPDVAGGPFAKVDARWAGILFADGGLAAATADWQVTFTVTANPGVVYNLVILQELAGGFTFFDDSLGDATASVGELTGTLAGLPGGIAAAAYPGIGDRNASTDGHHLSLSTLVISAPVPEPGTFALLSARPAWSRHAEEAMPPMNRRDFLVKSARAAGTSAGAFAGWPAPRASALAPPFGIDLRLSVGPIDHVIVLMMENRSFDHYFGWRTSTQHQVWIDHPENPAHPNHNQPVATHRLAPGDYRGCGHSDPDHGWGGGRLELAYGFLSGSNDEFAVGYYNSGDLDFYTALTNQFTLCDNYFAALLGPTFPNREYCTPPSRAGSRPTRCRRTSRAWRPASRGPRSGTSATRTACRGATTSSVSPRSACGGQKNASGAHHLEDLFADLAAGTLPNVTFVDPGFTTGLRTDEHPFGDARAGQAFVHNVVKAVIESPLWPRIALFVNYDEWGGFFDHVRPPRVADVRGTPADPAGENDFGQLGFRVPCTVVSPYAKRDATGRALLASQVVNNSTVFFEHCSILRYIESLFLRGRYLTARDRYARNIGSYLIDLDQPPRLDAARIVDALPRPLFQSCPCDGEVLEGTFVGDPIEAGAGDGFAQLAGVIEDLSGIPIGSPQLSDVC